MKEWTLRGVEWGKLFSLLLFSSIIISVRQTVPLLIVSFSILILLLLLPAKRKIYKRMRSLAFILVSVVCFNVLFYPSILLWQRLTNGILSGFKIVILSSVVLIYSHTTSIQRLISAFSILPKKVLLVAVITFSLIPAISNESEIISLVQVSRGYRKSMLHPIRTLLPQIIPLLHGVLRRAEQIAIVMVSKGYQDE